MEQDSNYIENNWRLSSRKAYDIFRVKKTR